MIRSPLLLLLLCAFPLHLAAQSYPSRPIRLIAPSPPASPVDIRARWVANQLGPVLNQTIVVDNRPGAGGNIGMEAAAKSTPDGHTLVIVHHGTMAVNPHIYVRAGYDPIADFAPITRLVTSALMLAVHSQVPAHSVTELVGLAKRNPGQLAYGSSGVGTPPHMAGEMLKRMTGMDVVHIPYKGAAPALNDLIGGRLAYTIDNLVMQLPHVKSGKLRALGVTGRQRVAAAPAVPTLAEAGVSGYEYLPWMGIVAPARTPREIVARLHTVLVHALRTPAATAWFTAQGGDIVADTPAQFAAVVREDFAHWGEIVRSTGIKAE